MQKQLVLLGLFFNTSSAAIAEDDTVITAFTKAEDFAKQQRIFPNSKDTRVQQQSQRSVRQIKQLTSTLKPEQLVKLVKMCKKKVHETPSDSKHQPYSSYLESVMHMSIMRLGEIKSNESARALEDLRPIIAGASSLTETLAEAQAKQSSSNKP